MFKSSGTFKFTKNWAVIDADINICRYYCHLYRTRYWNTKQLQVPMHGAHISVVTKYDFERHPEIRPQFKQLKNLWDKRKVKFSYRTPPVEGLTYSWLVVECCHAQLLRDQLDLGKPYLPFHLTIGNRKHEENEY